MNGDRHREMLFALLRLGLGTSERGPGRETGLFARCTQDDWRSCYQTAVMQGVAALAWDGLIKLSKELQPSREVRLPWGLYVTRCEEKHKYYCRAAGELSAIFAKNGIVMVQIKGVGFAEKYYPVPSHRECGDIDIYTCSADTAKMSHRQAHALADNLMAETLSHDPGSYKHSKFYFRNIPVENHRTFLNVKDWHSAVVIDKFLMEIMNPAATPLLGGEVAILTPSQEFCATHISYHALSHYYAGLRLHHLCDWAMILKHGRRELPSQVKESLFLDWTSHLTELCDCYLATGSGSQEVSVQAQKILESMFDPRVNEPVPHRDPLRIVVYKALRMWRRERARKRYLGRSLIRFSSVKYHIKHPSRIFKRT